MKKLLFLLLLCNITYAQTSTEKWNQYENRYEYFDSKGNMTGYKSYNQYERQWEYYDIPKKQTYQPQSNVNIPLAMAAMNKRQNAYDYNRARMQEVVNNIYKALSQIEDPAERKTKTDRFTKEYFDPVNKTPTDLSSNSTTDRIINYLNQGFINVLGY
jgi:coenzyme F420-reducing hydrogenase alpha subunit